MLNDRGSEVAGHFDQSHDIVLVFCSRQRAAAAELLQSAGLPARVLETGSPIGKARVRGQPRRPAMGAGAPGSPGCRIHRAVLGAGQRRFPTFNGWPRRSAADLTYAAISNTCAMGTGLSKLAVEPRCDVGCSDGPVAARGALSAAVKITASLAGPPARQVRKVTGPQRDRLLPRSLRRGLAR